MSDADKRLVFTTSVLRRQMPSGNDELQPLVSPALTSYGGEDRTTHELELALSELADEAHPPSIARLLYPPGVRLEQVEVELSRSELEGRLARPQRATITVVVIPEPRPGEAEPAGSWVFVPVIAHACFVGRKENLAKRISAELAVLPSALSLDLDGWKRLMTWAPADLDVLAIELATTPLAQVKGRKALAEAERKRQAQATLEAAARLIKPSRPAPPLVGRNDVLAELTRLLEATTRRSVLLVGDEAAGKSAVVEAWAAAHPSRPVWATSASELVAGASGLGEWQARVAAALAAVETLDVVLYFDDFGALFAERPAQGGVDIAGAIRRHVVDGRVRVVGELTAVALDRAERQDVSLIGAMSRIAIPATDPVTTIEACHAWAAHWRIVEAARPQIDPAMIPTAVDLARRYLPYRAFPGKALRLLEELRVAHDASRDAKGAGPVLGDAELYAAFSWSSGIPAALLDDRHAIAVEDVIAALRRRMIGQDAAVRRVAEALCIAKARLAPGDKPLASLLFVGPSGVGKTELARSVAAYLFGAPDRMVRLDMSEYTDPWAAERLFGGTSGEDGRLTAAVKSQPFGVVLLDEIEKAHPSVFDLLLQVLGEARLTDGRGRTTYFHNSLIVLTSNLGTRSAKGSLGLGPAEHDAHREERRYRDAVLAAFRPELVNRLDQIVVFHPLARDEIGKVAEIAIGRLAERRGLTQAGVLLDVSPTAIAALAEAGYSGELGARALRRHLDAALLVPAARLLAQAGAEAQGASLTVRTPDEPLDRPPGSRIGETANDVVITLWRRASGTGKRLVRGALALGELRRDTDRELARDGARQIRDKLAELEATLATATKKRANKAGLSGPELARLTTEHARLSALWQACAAIQGELRTAEELCIEALARDVDAVDLIDAAVAQRQAFRRDLFWLLVGLRPQRPGITLLVHSPDARAAVSAWLDVVLGAAEKHAWRASVHIFGEKQSGWKHAWGPPHDRAWAARSFMATNATASVVRVAGPGAESLLGLEAGLHRFTGLGGAGGAPCHAWVDLIDARTELTDLEWSVLLPTPPAPRAPRGAPMRDVIVASDRVTVAGDEIDPPWSALADRLEEAAVARVLSAQDHDGHDCRYDELDALWTYPGQAVDAAEKALP